MKKIYLGKNDSKENWYEITKAEAEERQKEQEEKTLKEAEENGLT